jgi:hypothetical protein
VYYECGDASPTKCVCTRSYRCSILPSYARVCSPVALRLFPFSATVCIVIASEGVLLVPGLTSTVLSLPPLPTSATENLHPTIAIQTPRPPLFRRLPLGRSCSTLQRRSVHRKHVFLFAHRAIQPACTPSTRFSGPLSVTVRKETHTGAHCWFVSLLCSCTTAERTQNKNPAKYLLTIEQMAENDYPSYLVDVFRKSEGCLKLLPMQEVLTQSMRLTVKWGTLLLRAIH